MNAQDALARFHALMGHPAPRREYHASCEVIEFEQEAPTAAQVLSRFALYKAGMKPGGGGKPQAYDDHGRFSSGRIGKVVDGVVDFNDFGGYGATYRNHEAQQKAIAEFDDLPDDALVAVYHGTSPVLGANIVSTGRFVEGQRDATRDGKIIGSASPGIYVAPTHDDAANYGEYVVRMVVPKGSLAPSIETGENASTARALMNSSAGAVIRPEHKFDATHVSKSLSKAGVKPGGGGKPQGYDDRGRYTIGSSRGRPADSAIVEVPGMGIYGPLRGTSAAHATATHRNDNPMSQEARANLKRVGARISNEEMVKLRAQIISKHNKAKRIKPTDRQKQKLADQKAQDRLNRQAGRTLRGTRGANDQRGSAKNVRDRKKAMLKEFGDGHTCGCGFCGVRLDFRTLTVEKMRPVLGYVRENIAPACGGCNSAASDVPFTTKLGMGKSRSPLEKFATGQYVRAIVNRAAFDNREEVPTVVVGPLLRLPSVTLDGKTVLFHVYHVDGWPVIPNTIRSIERNNPNA